MGKWFTRDGPENDVVLSTRVRLSRNLRGIPFPHRMSAADFRLADEKIRAAVFDGKSSLANIFRRVDMEGLTNVEAVSLAECQLVGADFICERSGRDLLVNDDESACIMINGGNHVTLQSLSSGAKLSEVYETADKIDTILDKTLHFAFDKKLGYLTQDPVELGTGMLASLSLHLPALMDLGSTGRLSSNFSKLGLSLRGVYGSAIRPRGAVYQLSNQVTLGLSEQAVISNLNSIAAQIISQERAAQQKLIQNIGVRDTIGRSLGILQNARVLTNDEFLDLISIVRLGIAQGLIRNIGYEKISSLVFRVQPATLTRESGKQLTAIERRTIRADIVREALNEAVPAA